MAATETGGMNDKIPSSITDENDPDGLEETADGRRRYRAPALDKGLDILELLAREGTPMTPSQIAVRLDRSVSELFRMILGLEFRGYIEQSSDGQGYELTNKLFTLGMARVRVRVLLEVALPIMRDLSREIDQSCHLGMASGDQMVVVARIENPGYLGFSVRPGYRRALVESTSGLVLFAFQHEATRKDWAGQFESGAGNARLESFLRQAEVVRNRGFAQAGSDFVQGVTDLSAPIKASSGCIAALTVPFVQRASLPRTMVEAIDLVCTAAQRISQLLVGSG
jgi:DNA-binding IclR family transcriptional regulator